MTSRADAGDTGAVMIRMGDLGYYLQTEMQRLLRGTEENTRRFILRELGL